MKLELGGADSSTALQFFLLLTVLSLVPAILMMVTSFVRITIVLSFVRNAIGAQQMPFKSHAWVEVDGRVVNDKPYTPEIYAVLDRC